MTYDVCAYTNRIFTKTCSAADYQSVYSGLTSALVSGGWTEVGSDEYLSEQSPWLAGETPDYYVGRVRIKLTRIGHDLQVKAGNASFTIYHNDPILLKSTASYSNITGTYTIIVSPYQLIVFLTDEQVSGLDQLGVLVSALQVPKFVATRLEVIEAIISIPIGKFRDVLGHLSGQDNYFLHFNTTAGTYTRHSERGNVSGSFTFLSYTMAGMDSYPYGDPIISPPFVCWNIETEYEKASIIGFLWDAIIIGKLATWNERFSVDGHNWLIFTEGHNKGALALVTGGLS